MNILITSASRKVGLIKAFQRALTEEDGGQVIAVDASPRSAALYFADKSFIVPQGLDGKFFDSIKNICRENDVELIIPTRDEELPFFAARKNDLRKLGITVMVPDLGVVETCRDKRRFIDFCMKNKFAIPRTYNISELDKVTDFPIFIKERFGKGSKNIFLVKSRSELELVLKKMDNPIIQEHIDAKEYTVDLFADFSGNVISVVPRERISILGGESFVGKTQKEWNIITESIRLAKALGLTGHNTIQCFLHDGSVKFIEVNPRYGGGANLGFAAGAFTPRYLIRVILGKDVRPEIGQFEDGYLMLRYTEDIFLSDQEVK